MEQRINSSMAAHLGFRRRRFRLFRPLDGRSALYLPRVFVDDKLMSGNGPPAMRSTELAMLRSGVLKSGRSISASNRPAIQNMCIWVNSAKTPEDSHDLELQFLRFVSHPLRQRMQLQVKIADGQDYDDEENAHHDHQDVRFTGRRNERRQMMRSQRM
jgi:hypothetical protein